MAAAATDLNPLKRPNQGDIGEPPKRQKTGQDDSSAASKLVQLLIPSNPLHSHNPHDSNPLKTRALEPKTPVVQNKTTQLLNRLPSQLQQNAPPPISLVQFQFA